MKMPGRCPALNFLSALLGSETPTQAGTNAYAANITPSDMKNIAERVSVLTMIDQPMPKGVVAAG